jgi:hypothetical protein
MMRVRLEEGGKKEREDKLHQERNELKRGVEGQYKDRQR